MTIPLFIYFFKSYVQKHVTKPFRTTMVIDKQNIRVFV